MSRVTDQYVVCDHCGGAIPDGADFITNLSGTLVLSGAQTGFSALDFCCTEHAKAWIATQPVVAIPDPPYAAPPST